ncbi:erythromycin esterase family protein [Haloplanus halophilus]|uniref:erythromycin esterase family protein n=1 Tax=Haloplanus halophilus TaxID=2949993 RepID=UPI00203C8501|nr:erythromycin esterase family protein [Haloplanus sp. GDY1]
MPSKRHLSRRRFVALAVGTGALAGCAGDGDGGTATPETTTRTETATDTGTPTPERTTAADERAVVDAVERVAVPFELTPPAAGLDTVAARLAESRIVGIGENSHGVAEFKTIPELLVPRLVSEHGYRLVAVEGTLGEFAPVNEYVTGGDVTLDEAMASLEFYFWKADGIRRLFEWLREWNAGRPAGDRAVVHGYDAQFFDVNATAIRDYLARVDPAYLDDVEADLTPLTEPLYERHEVEFVTDERLALLDALRERLRTHRREYVAASSESAWRLARRHVRTLERALRFQAELQAENYTRGKSIRDAAMANNVAWLREWTGSDRAVVLGNSNHTMRNDGGDGATRMGQHLSDEFGDDYYSLGMLFGTGTFAAPTGSHREAFETYDLDGPVEGTLAATLAEVEHSHLFLDFDAASDRPQVDALLDDISTVQFSVPRAAKRGAVPLPVSPDAVFDGVTFVHTASPASFSSPE